MFHLHNAQAPQNIGELVQATKMYAQSYRELARHGQMYAAHQVNQIFMNDYLPKVPRGYMVAGERRDLIADIYILYNKLRREQ